MRISASLLLLLSLIFLRSYSQKQNSNFTISSPPEWVKQIRPDYGSIQLDEVSSNYYFLLINLQSRIVDEQEFGQYAIKILTADGLKEMSDLQFDFDPNYQKLILHEITVNRNAQLINQLDYSSVKVIQREQQMERHIYDGKLTAIVNLKDVRIGDIIQYSYSIVGYNPVFEGHYFSKMYLQSSIPVERLHFRLIVPKEKNMYFDYQNGAFYPEISENATSKIFTWDRRKVPLILYDINTPLWCDPYPFVNITDYVNWEEVVNWGLKLFSVDESEKYRLKAKVKAILDQSSLDSTILRAIRFTQDEIRYLGFIEGLYTHKPHQPLQILSHRYGDCKDKSLFLVELLKSYGIDAVPVLVHSTNGQSLDDELPDPNVFNHCVVQFVKDDSVFYVDPTFSYQGGDLKHNYFPNYYSGLVLREGEKTFTDLPTSTCSGIKTTETYDIQEIGGRALLNVHSVYTGAAADHQRNFLASNNYESVQQAYLEYYSTLYPRIKVNRIFTVNDDRANTNTLTIEEYYDIDNPWEISLDDEDVINFEYCPLILLDYVDIPQSPQRTMPYLLNFPLELYQDIIIQLPEEWTVEEEKQKIESDAFWYVSSVKYDDRSIRIHHGYKILKPFIEANQVESFVQKHDKILDNLTYQLSYNEKLASESFNFSWFAGIISIITLLGSGYAAYRIYYGKDLPVTVQPEENVQIGGWLVLIAIGITLTPIRLFSDIVTSPEYFNTYIWSSMFDIDATTRNMLTAVLMLFELIFHISMFVFSILLVALFYNKRTILPRMFIIIYTFTLLFVMLDNLIAFNLNPTLYTSEEKVTSYSFMFGSFVSYTIWVLYFIYSKRVKMTFVKRIDYQIPEANVTFKDEKPFVLTGNKKSWLLLVAGILMVVIIFLVINRNLENHQLIPQTRPLEVFEPEFAIPPAEKMTPRTPFSQSWKYAILQCVNKREDEVQLRIITINEFTKALEILDSLEQGVSFVNLAHRQSMHPTKSEGGQLGWFKISELDKRFQVALKDVSEGAYTKIIHMDSK